MQRVSVIIPSFKRVTQTIRTIKLLLASEGIGTEYVLEVIVSDCSPDDTLQQAVFKAFGDTVIYTRPPQAGISTNKNHGASIAKGTILIFCDSDIEVQPKTLLYTLTALQKHTSVAAITGNIVWKHGGSKEGTLDRPRKEDRMFVMGSTQYLEAIYSRYIATYKKVFDDVGGYDEEVFNMRGEGSDLSVRYWRAGFPIAYDASIVVQHVYDAPDSIALRVAHPEWGIAKDLVLLAYKYAILEDTNTNFITTVAANFAQLGERGYFAILQGIVANMDSIREAIAVIDKQKAHTKAVYPFKHLEIFSNKTMVESCIHNAQKKLAAVRKEVFL